MTDDYIKAEILLVLLAGADTTGTAFQGMIYHITKNRDVYSKLMQEIDSSTKSGKIGEMPQYDDVLKHCPYYVSCVKETMRLNPSAPTILPRIVGKGGIELEGHFVPEGTEITCNPWLVSKLAQDSDAVFLTVVQVHRDTAVFGEDAEIFRPERWMEDEERTKLLNKYNMVFGYGSRSCLGKVTLPKFTRPGRN